MFSKPMWVYLVHLFILSPVLIYIGYKNGLTNQPISAGNWIFSFLFWIGIIALLLHGWLLVKDLWQIYKKQKVFSINDKHMWVNVLHVFIVAPILIVIGSRNSKITKSLPPRHWTFDMLLAIGVMMFVWHGLMAYKLWKAGGAFTKSVSYNSNKVQNGGGNTTDKNLSYIQERRNKMRNGIMIKGGYKIDKIENNVDQYFHPEYREI
jgi:hypothetical protein